MFWEPGPGSRLGGPGHPVSPYPAWRETGWSLVPVLAAAWTRVPGAGGVARGTPPALQVALAREAENSLCASRRGGLPHIVCEGLAVAGAAPVTAGRMSPQALRRLRASRVYPPGYTTRFTRAWCGHLDSPTRSRVSPNGHTSGRNPGAWRRAGFRAWPGGPGKTRDWGRGKGFIGMMIYAAKMGIPEGPGTARDTDVD